LSFNPAQLYLTSVLGDRISNHPAAEATTLAQFTKILHSVLKHSFYLSLHLCAKDAQISGKRIEMVFSGKYYEASRSRKL